MPCFAFFLMLPTPGGLSISSPGEQVVPVGQKWGPGPRARLLPPALAAAGGRLLPSPLFGFSSRRAGERGVGVAVWEGEREGRPGNRRREGEVDAGPMAALGSATASRSQGSCTGSGLAEDAGQCFTKGWEGSPLPSRLPTCPASLFKE